MESIRESIVNQKEWRNTKGLLHIEYACGDRCWYINGKYHREDGPAIEWANGDKSWYIKGKELTKQEFNKFIAKKRIGKLR